MAHIVFNPCLLVFFSFASYLTLSQCKRISLSEFCVRHVTGDREFPVHPVLQVYYQMCQNFLEYSHCILLRRQFTSNPKYFVQPYERHFPTANNLRVSGILFCKNILPQLTKKFPPNGTMPSCPINSSLCSKNVSKDDVVALWKYNKIRHVPFSIDRSCRIQAPFLNCLRSQYVKCDIRFIQIFDFELAKLGGKCLVKFGINGRLAPYRNCKFTISSRLRINQAVRCMSDVLLVLGFAVVLAQYWLQF